MCFSAEASFGSGVILTVIGVATIKKVQSPSQLYFASIPILFAVQQITEGFLWLALSYPAFAFLQEITTYTFLFFAQVIWPALVPFSVLKLEPKSKHRRILKLFLLIGVSVSIYLGYCLLMFPVESKVIESHISYLQDYPEGVAFYSGMLYIIATVLAVFFSAVRCMWWLGSAILFSYLMTTVFYTEYIVSVWCFFAAVISSVIWGIMDGMKRDAKNKSIVAV